MAVIISASRRTDIPRYFGRWFAERRKQGTAEFRNVFGGRGQVSMRSQDVLGYLFWTRYARPFTDQLEALRDEGTPYIFQYTITGLGRDIEPYVPHRARAIEDFLAVSRDLPDPGCIQWRYDPIFLSDRYTTDFHRRNFAEIASALESATLVVNVSVVEPYLKAIRRVADPSARYRTVSGGRHKSVLKRHPTLPQVGSDLVPFLEELQSIAAQHGMELRSCCNPEWGLPPSQCCGLDLFAAFGQKVSNAVASQGPGPSRENCRCFKTVDIGMDNTCLAGCKYCYVVDAHNTAIAHYRNHDPARATLR